MANFYIPQNNLLGPGCLEEISDAIAARGYRKTLIVTDTFMEKTETFRRLLAALMKAGCSWKVYNGTVPNPTVENVEEAYGLICKDPCDFIVSLGGGSAHDCAKAVGITATSGGCIRQYAGTGKLRAPILPLIAVNTTAGTGSEVTGFCIITDRQQQTKLAIVDPAMTSWISVNDPTTMMSKPPALTAATGMDALTHAIEAYVSTNASCITDALALHAIRQIIKFLPEAVEHGQNVEAREKMAEAQFMAGGAFSNASLGWVHAIAHQLGGIYNLPHGLCNAVLLPYVVEYNGSRMKNGRFADIAAAFGRDMISRQDRFSSKFVADNIRKLNTRLGIPARLRDIGVKKEDFGMIISHALEDACASTNPVQTGEAGIGAILKAAW